MRKINHKMHKHTCKKNWGLNFLCRYEMSFYFLNVSQGSIVIGSIGRLATFMFSQRSMTPRIRKQVSRLRLSAVCRLPYAVWL